MIIRPRAKSKTVLGSDVSGNISGNAANVTGIVAVPNGGTGATTLTGYLKGSGTSAFTASSTVPGSDVSGNISGNAANVTGTVAIANGGTGATSAVNAATNLSADYVVTSMAALKALTARPSTVSNQYYSTAGDLGGGTWVWRSGDQSANVSADTRSALWAAPDSDSTGASGAWQRQYDGYPNIRWWGVTGNGSTSDDAAFVAAFAMIQSLTIKTLYIPKPSSAYLVTSTLELSGIRGFRIIGERASSGAFLTTINKAGTGAADNGILRIKTCTDWTIEGVDFRITGTLGAKQAVELMANDLPALSCLKWVFRSCQFRRLSTTPEFTVAALSIRNVAQFEIYDCVFPVSAVAMRLGEDNGVEPSTYGNGHVTVGTIKYCHLFGDIERRNCSLMTYEGNFHDIKWGTSPTQPSVFTLSGNELVRLERVISNFCDPASVDHSRTYLAMGSNANAEGLVAMGNRISEVAIGFDVVSTRGNAIIEGNLFDLGNASDIGVRIASGVQGEVRVGANDFSLMTGAGSQRVDDNRTVLPRQPMVVAVAPANYTITASGAWETARTESSVRLRGGRVKVSYSLTFTGAQTTDIRARVTINGTTYNSTVRSTLHTTGQISSLSLSPVVIYVDDPGTTCDVLLEVYQVTGASYLTMVGSAATGSSFLCIEQVP